MPFSKKLCVQIRRLSGKFRVFDLKQQSNSTKGRLVFFDKLAIFPSAKKQLRLIKRNSVGFLFSVLRKRPPQTLVIALSPRAV